MLKNTLFLTATLGLALFAPACGGDKDGGTGDTSDTDTVVGDDDDDTPGPTGIEGYGVACAGGNVTFDVTTYLTDGSEAIVDVADTANAGGYYEAHSFGPTASGAGATDFSLTIPADGSYSNGVSSLFSCDPDTHYEEDPKGKIMTYVVRAYDLGGLADCFAVGQDTSGMIGGAYKTYGNVDLPEDISAANCSEGSWSR